MTQALRESLVTQVRLRCGTTERVAEALRVVPRHVFLPGIPYETVYSDEAIVTKRDANGLPVSSSSQPAIMAVMLDQLDVEPGQRVLEIGTGTGYNAALIAHLVGPAGEVVTVDIDRDLTDLARARLAEAGYSEVTVVCADGAGGFAARAPYDRIIATVGVWDLAPSWMDQLAWDGRIVVPLDLRGVQRSVAFAREDAHWASRSVEPCGFMRLRGAFAGPEQIHVLDQARRLALAVPDNRTIKADRVRAALAGRVTDRATGVAAAAADLFNGLGLWLALHEPRWCGVSEWDSSVPARLAAAPLRIQDQRITAGIVDDDSLAILGQRVPGGELSALGYGPDAGTLADQLAARVRAWDTAGRPATEGLRIDAYPRSTPDDDDLSDRLVIDKVHTRLALTWGRV